LQGGNDTVSRPPSSQSATTTSSPEPSKPARRVAAPAEPVSETYQGALKANLDGEFAAVVLANGRKTVVPIESLAPEDLAYLKWLAEEKPLVAAGKSSVKVVKSTDTNAGPKQTIAISHTEGTLETVQLCPPNSVRDQIGATCMLYARVQWLDIAGYYVETPDIYKIINETPPDHPWTSPKYVEGLDTIITDFKSKPVVHPLPLAVDEFAWARAELRRGRPLLAALPREIVQVLPPDFLVEYPWSGGSVGHQIVVNGFTWDEKTNDGTFHVVNTWAQLPEFDIPIRYATGGGLVFEASMSPKGEEPTREEREAALAAANEKVQSVAYLKPVGNGGLFEVTTNLGVRKIIAPNAAAACRMVEEK
jgi:hypothetical protein